MDDPSVERALPRLILFNDGSVAQKTAASILHAPPAGSRARGRNIVEQMRCVFQHQSHAPVTSGMMELAGIALSMFLAGSYCATFVGVQFHIFLFCDSKPVVDFALQEGQHDAGARHLTALVAYVRAHVDELRNAGHVVELGWASRDTQGIQRAHELAAHGIPSMWPDNLYDLLLGVSQVYAAASSQEREIMDSI